MREFRPPARSYVNFRFRLPDALLLRAPVGEWPRAPRGARLEVGAGGAVTVTSYDSHESFAREQVLRLAASFLRAIDSDVPPTVLPATLGNGEREQCYAIALGAKVSISRASEAPLVA